MSNMTDVTDVTDAVLDAFLAAKTQPYVDVDHLTVTERGQLARLMGWEPTTLTNYWKHVSPLNDRLTVKN